MWDYERFGLRQSEFLSLLKSWRRRVSQSSSVRATIALSTPKSTTRDSSLVIVSCSKSDINTPIEVK